MARIPALREVAVGAVWRGYEFKIFKFAFPAFLCTCTQAADTPLEIPNVRSPLLYGRNRRAHVQDRLSVGSYSGGGCTFKIFKCAFPAFHAKERATSTSGGGR